MADEIQTPVNTQTTTTKIEAVSTSDSSQSDESHIGTVSIRSLIAVILIASICILAFTSKVIPDVLANLSVGISAFYFGHVQGKNSK